MSSDSVSYVQGWVGGSGAAFENGGYHGMFRPLDVEIEPSDLRRRRVDVFIRWQRRITNCVV